MNSIHRGICFSLCKNQFIYLHAHFFEAKEQENKMNKFLIYFLKKTKLKNKVNVHVMITSSSNLSIISIPKTF